jgi:hypothetical protein|tara:strand:+ start:2160 stop:2315 length:156 start_codon:yes stop_codon:yes gene_type:complete
MAICAFFADDDKFPILKVTICLVKKAASAAFFYENKSFSGTFVSSQRGANS